MSKLDFIADFEECAVCLTIVNTHKPHNKCKGCGVILCEYCGMCNTCIKKPIVIEDEP